MDRSSFVLVYSLLGLAALGGYAAAQAPAPSPTIALNKARSLYYTPTDAGLQGFHCEVGFDWKTFMQKATNQPVPDDDARLQYLKTIQLSVDDDLHGAGELHWVAPAPAPDEAEDSVGKIRGGMQQMWTGFFQSWNGFLTGDMVTLDTKATVDRNAGGFHVAVRTGPALAEEQFDDKLVLQSVHVATPNLDSNEVPTFQPTSHGLLVSGIRTIYRQPPASDPTEVSMQVSYAPVGSFQLPSQLSVSVGPANFVFHLANCTVKARTSTP